MADNSPIEIASKSLDTFRDGLASDGYELVVDRLEDGVLHVDIIAGEGACEDCLVPKSLMESMLMAELPLNLNVSVLQLRYPVEMH